MILGEPLDLWRCAPSRERGPGRTFCTGRIATPCLKGGTEWLGLFVMFAFAFVLPEMAWHGMAGVFGSVGDRHYVCMLYGFAYDTHWCCLVVVVC